MKTARYLLYVICIVSFVNTSNSQSLKILIWFTIVMVKLLKPYKHLTPSKHLMNRSTLARYSDQEHW